MKKENKIFGLFWDAGDQKNRKIEITGVHQTDSGFIRLYSTKEGPKYRSELKISGKTKAKIKEKWINTQK